MRFKTFLILFFLLATCFWIIYSGLGTRLPAADLRFGNASEPQTLDPAKMTGTPEGRIARALFEGLTRPNLRDLTNPLPAVAQRWEVSPNGLTYRFFLRENLRWSNGKPLDAKDFLFSWRRTMSPTTASQYAELMWSIKGARAFNQQLFYLADKGVILRKKPSDKSELVLDVASRRILIREDLDQKVIRLKRSAVRKSPDLTAEISTRLPKGKMLWILDKVRKGAVSWYQVSTEKDEKKTALGWLRADSFAKSSKKIKASKSKWIEVTVRNSRGLRGWVRQKSLSRPDYTFPSKKKNDLPKAWDLVGLRALKIKEPLPKGYTKEAIGKYLIFEVTLENPTAYFIQLTNFYVFFPVYPPLVLKRPRSWVLPKYFVGNGPFKLTHWFINDLIRAERNPMYWNVKNNKLASIHFLAINERDTQLSMYLSNDLDIVTNVPLPAMDKLRTRKDFHNKPYLGSYFYRFNTTRPPLNDVNLRRALAWSIDRKSIVKHVLRGGQIPASGHVPPGIQGYPTYTKGPHFNPRKARAFLKQSAYGNLKTPLTLSLLYNTDQQHKQVAEAIQKMWKKYLGISVNLVNKEWKTYLDAVTQKEYQLARAGWIGDYTDPNTFLSMFITGGGHNRTGWSNSSYDGLILAAEKTTDPKKRYKLFRRAESLLMDEVPILPIFYYTYQNLVNPRIKGYVSNPLNMFDYMSLRRVKESQK